MDPDDGYDPAHVIDWWERNRPGYVHTINSREHAIIPTFPDGFDYIDALRLLVVHLHYVEVCDDRERLIDPHVD